MGAVVEIPSRWGEHRSYGVHTTHLTDSYPLTRISVVGHMETVGRNGPYLPTRTCLHGLDVQAVVFTGQETPCGSRQPRDVPFFAETPLVDRRPILSDALICRWSNEGWKRTAPSLQGDERRPNGLAKRTGAMLRRKAKATDGRAEPQIVCSTFGDTQGATDKTQLDDVQAPFADLVFRHMTPASWPPSTACPRRGCSC